MAMPDRGFEGNSAVFNGLLRISAVRYTKSGIHLKRRAATEGRPYIYVRVSTHSGRKCRGGPPWPPVVQLPFELATLCPQ